MNWYTKKSLGIYWFRFLRWANRYLLPTYESNPDCARCRDCGRTVHDWHTDDETFTRVVGSAGGVWCWDCFAERARMKGVEIECTVKEAKINDKREDDVGDRYVMKEKRDSIAVELDFIPVGDKSMPRGREFMVLYIDGGKWDFGRAWMEEKPEHGLEDTIWHPSMDWSYDECEGLTITHWAEIPQIRGD